MTTRKVVTEIVSFFALYIVVGITTPYVVMYAMDNETAEVDVFSDLDRYQLEKLKSEYFKLSSDAVTAQLLAERKQVEMNNFVEGLKGKCLQSEGRIAEIEGDLMCMAKVQSIEPEEPEEQ